MICAAASIAPPAPQIPHYPASCRANFEYLKANNINEPIKQKLAKSEQKPAPNATRFCVG
jgi:hypothetical protein